MELLQRDGAWATEGAQTARLSEAMRVAGLGALDIESLSALTGRNQNWLGHTANGTEVFVKVLTGAPEETLRRFRSSTLFEEIIAAADIDLWRSPDLLAADEGFRLLVYQAVPDVISAASLAQEDLFHTTLAERFGHCLAELHNVSSPRLGAGTVSTQAAGNKLVALRLREYTESSGGELDAWALMQHDKHLRQALKSLTGMSARARHVPSHGDLRLDQFLVAGDDIYIIDWEEFRELDAAFDLGSFIGEWLNRAAMLMFSNLDSGPDLTPAEVHALLVSRGERELDLVRPFITSFWAGYRERCKESDPELPVRATAYAGWHLFDRMLAGAMVKAYLSNSERAVAGIGRNALVEPAEYVTSLGLTWE